MPDTYTFEVNMDDIKKVFPEAGTYPTDGDMLAFLEYVRDVVVVKIRGLLTRENRSLDIDIASGRLNELEIKNLVAIMVKRTYTASLQKGEYANVASVQRGAGSYTETVTPIQSELSVYIKKEERRVLQLRTSRRYNIRAY